MRPVMSPHNGRIADSAFVLSSLVLVDERQSCGVLHGLCRRYPAVGRSLLIAVGRATSEAFFTRYDGSCLCALPEPAVARGSGADYLVHALSCSSRAGRPNLGRSTTSIGISSPRSGTSPARSSGARLDEARAEQAPRPGALDTYWSIPSPAWTRRVRRDTIDEI